MKKIILLILFLLLNIILHAQLSKQPEVYYQNLFAAEIGGQMEVQLSDLSRVDIVTDTFAIEVDFGPKWAESIGQSLFYGLKLNKTPGIVLIVNKNYEYKNVNRLLSVAKEYHITVWLLDYSTNTYRRILN